MADTGKNDTVAKNDKQDTRKAADEFKLKVVWIISDKELPDAEFAPALNSVLLPATQWREKKGRIPLMRKIFRR